MFWICVEVLEDFSWNWGRTILLKFRYSEKATTIWKKMSHFVLTLLSNLKKKLGDFFECYGSLTIPELYESFRNIARKWSWIKIELFWKNKLFDPIVGQSWVGWKSTEPSDSVVTFCDFPTRAFVIKCKTERPWPLWPFWRRQGPGGSLTTPDRNCLQIYLLIT